MAGDMADNSTRRSWLYHPEFPEHWTRQPLYSLAAWVNGLAFRNIQFSADGMPVIKIAEIKGGITGQTKFTQQIFDESVRVKHGDMLFSWSGQPETSIDVFWWYGPEGWLNQHVFRVTPAACVDRAFFYYLLRYLNPNFVGIASNKQTTGLGHVTKRDLDNIEVAYPGIREQQAIACILGALDDKIELNRQLNRTLEDIARAIFKSWFVDFDPVRSKASGQKPPGLKPEIAALFPNAFEDSKLGEIPKGWEVKSFTNDIDVIGGGTPKTSNPAYWDGNIPWFSVADTPATGEVFVISTEKTITQEGLNNSSTRILPFGTTIISARGTVGNLALVGIPMAMNQSCYGLRDRRGGHGYFLYFATSAVVDILRQRTHGSVFNTITRNTLDGVRVVTPPDELIKTFEDSVGGMLLRILTALQQNKTLAAIRDTLLPKLISGELRVKDAERIAGRCV